MNHNKIATLRKEWALTQDELASLLGVTRSSVSKLEVTEEPCRLETALTLRALFDIGVSSIFPLHYRAAHEALVDRLAVFSRAIEPEKGAVADRKRQLLSAFANREPVADESP